MCQDAEGGEDQYRNNDRPHRPGDSISVHHRPSTFTTNTQMMPQNSIMTRVRMLLGCIDDLNRHFFTALDGLLDLRIQGVVGQDGLADEVLGLAAPY